MAPPLGLSPAEVLVAPLGGFSGHCPDDVGRGAARRYFGIGAEAPAFVTLGAARAYESLDLLLRAFASVRERLTEARLVVAGRTGQPACGARFVEPAPGVLMVPHYMDGATVQYALRAADHAVLAFRRVMVVLDCPARRDIRPAGDRSRPADSAGDGGARLHWHRLSGG